MLSGIIPLVLDIAARLPVRLLRTCCYDTRCGQWHGRAPLIRLPNKLRGGTGTGEPGSAAHGSLFVARLDAAAAAAVMQQLASALVITACHSSVRSPAHLRQLGSRLAGFLLVVGDRCQCEREKATGGSRLFIGDGGYEWAPKSMNEGTDAKAGDMCMRLRGSQ